MLPVQERFLWLLPLIFSLYLVYIFSDSFTFENRINIKNDGKYAYQNYSSTHELVNI